MQVGTTKDHGLYNKPSAAVHPGALVAGTLLQCNTTNHVRVDASKYPAIRPLIDLGSVTNQIP